MIGQILHNRYTISALLGEGAMGEVYRATDAQTGLEAAVKVITQKLAFDDEMIERFRREGDALRQLRHANIVAFVDMFLHGKQHVIVMEYVPGGSLHTLIQRGPLPVDQAVRIALELCDALTRAHHLNIIHRDIKPENVLMAQDGTPKLTDFGLARLVSETARLTGSGTQLGTPYYMSPEAWEGKPLDAQADIWSLGVMLFEMLSGQVPFGGETLVSVMNKVLTAPPPDLKALRPEVPAALVRIIQRMLLRDKARRYQSIREVALDLERVMKGEEGPAVTEPRGAAPGMSRRGKFLLAGVLVIGVLTVLCVLSVGGVGLVGAQLLSAARPTPTRALPAPSKTSMLPTAAPGKTLTPPAVVSPPPASVRQTFEAQAQTPGAMLTEQALLQQRLTGTPAAPQITLAAPVPINTILPQSSRAISPDNAASVRQVALIDGLVGGGPVLWSPDGKYLAIGAYGFGLYDSKTFKLVRKLGDQTWVRSFAFTPDGQAVALPGENGVTLWRTDTGGQVKVFPDLKNVDQLAVSPDGKILAVGIGQVVKLVDTINGGELATLPVGSSEGNLIFSPDGKWLVTAGGVAGQAIVGYDVASGKPIFSLAGHSNWIKQVVFSADGRWLASASVDQTAKVWDVTTGLVQTTLTGHTGQVDGVALSPDGRIAASISWDLTVKLWDTATGQALNSLTGHTGWGWAIAFSPDGALVASGDNDGSVRVWGLPADGGSGATPTPRAAGPIPTALPLAANAIAPENVDQLKQLAVNDGARAGQIVFAPDGQQLAVTSSGVYFFEPRTLKKLSVTLPQGSSLAYAPDGKRLAVATYDGMKLYQINGGGELISFAGSKGTDSVAFSPDGTWLASLSGATVKLWDAASGQELRTLPCGDSWPGVNLAFSPDGKWLVASGGMAGTEISVWDTNTWQVVYTLKGHSNWIERLVFAPGSRMLASGSSDNTIRLWDLATGLLARTINVPQDIAGNSNQVPGLAFSPDGRLLVSSYGVPQFSIWETASGNELRRMTGPTSMVRAVAFSPDGAYLITSDDALRLWGIAP